MSTSYLPPLPAPPPLQPPLGTRRTLAGWLAEFGSARWHPLLVHIRVWSSEVWQYMFRQG
eukprot:3937216-Rhodomonas_salina.2